MNRFQIIVIVIIGIIAGGCSKSLPASERAREEMQAMEKVYCSSNRQDAKDTLFSYLRLLKTQKEQGIPGHDFLFGTFMTHGRLFCLYTQEGDTNVANAHYQKGVDLWLQWRELKGFPRLDTTNFTWVVQQYDKSLDIKWKIQAPNTNTARSEK